MASSVYLWNILGSKVSITSLTLLLDTSMLAYSTYNFLSQQMKPKVRVAKRHHIIRYDNSKYEQTVTTEHNKAEEITLFQPLTDLKKSVRKVSIIMRMEQKEKEKGKGRERERSKRNLSVMTPQSIELAQTDDFRNLKKIYLKEAEEVERLKIPDPPRIAPTTAAQPIERSYSLM